MDNFNDQYYNAVKDLSKLLMKSIIESSIRLDGNVDQNHYFLEQIISKVEIKLEQQVSRISPLYELLDLQKDEKSSPYWEGIRDTTNLIRNFFFFKKKTVNIDNLVVFLENIIIKTNLKLQPPSSPLREKLGISFHDYLQKTMNSESTINSHDIGSFNDGGETSLIIQKNIAAEADDSNISHSSDVVSKPIETSKNDNKERSTPIDISKINEFTGGFPIEMFEKQKTVLDRTPSLSINPLGSSSANQKEDPLTNSPLNQQNKSKISDLEIQKSVNDMNKVDKEKNVPISLIPLFSKERKLNDPKDDVVEDKLLSSKLRAALNMLQSRGDDQVQL